jgi:hypothetical protein
MVADAEQTQIAKYRQAIGDAIKEGKFHSWFNRADNQHHAEVNGAWDFAIHIVTPQIKHLLGTPQNQTALEIGPGISIRSSGLIFTAFRLTLSRIARC